MDSKDALTLRKGRCHCGAVAFEFRSEVSTATICNCSYCQRKAALHHRVAADHFTLTSGIDRLAVYRFGTMRASHYFCANCGIHTHCHPRSAPDEINVNLHCVESIREGDLEIKLFDGRSWLA